MPFDLPDAPVLDQTVTMPDGTVYVWDGTVWRLQVVSGDFLPLVGGTLTGDLIVSTVGTTSGLTLMTADPVVSGPSIRFNAGVTGDSESWAIGTTPSTIPEFFINNLATSAASGMDDLRIGRSGLTIGSSYLWFAGSSGAFDELGSGPLIYSYVNAGFVFKLAENSATSAFRFADEAGVAVATIASTGNATFKGGLLTIGDEADPISRLYFRGASGNPYAFGGPMIHLVEGTMLFKGIPDNDGDMFYNFVDYSGQAFFEAAWRPNQGGAKFDFCIPNITAANTSMEIRFAGGSYHWYLMVHGNETVAPGDMTLTAYHVESGVASGNFEHIRFPLEGGLYISGAPDFDVANTFHDATLRLTANTQSWDLIGATPDSGSAPGTFIIADATTGTRRLIIDPGATDSATAVQITSAGDLLVHGVPIGGAGAYVPLDGSLPMTGGLEITGGGLEIDTTVGGFNAYITLTTTQATGPAAWTIYNYDQSAIQAGAFSINDGPSRFRIDPIDPAAPLPPPPVVITPDGSISLGVGANLFFAGETVGGVIDGGPLIQGDSDGLLLKGGAGGDVFRFRSYTGSDMVMITEQINAASFSASLYVSGYESSVQAHYFMVGKRNFADLPAVAGDTSNTGRIAHISDSPTTSLGAVVTAGGGTDNVLLYDNGTSWVVLGAASNGTLVLTGPLDTLGQSNDATLSLTSGAQTWDLIAQSAGSSAPSAFTISDATTGERRLVIEPAVPVGTLNPTMPDPVVISGGMIKLNGQNALYPAANNPIGPFIFSDDYTFMLRMAGDLDTGYGFVVSDNKGESLFNFSTGGMFLYCQGRAFTLQNGNLGVQAGTITMGGGNKIISESPGDGYTQELSFWDGGYYNNPDSAKRLQITGAGTASTAHPVAGGENLHNAANHIFRSHDTLTEYARIDATGISIGGVPIGTGGGATISDTPPATPTPGTLWFDSASLKLAIWYDDGTSQQWITV